MVLVCCAAIHMQTSHLTVLNDVPIGDFTHESKPGRKLEQPISSATVTILFFLPFFVLAVYAQAETDIQTNTGQWMSLFNISNVTKQSWLDAQMVNYFENNNIQSSYDSDRYSCKQKNRISDGNAYVWLWNLNFKQIICDARQSFWINK